MTTASPTIVTIEVNSTWIIILAVSLVTLVAALVLRRLIGRPGGLASGILLGLPLLLPVVAAIIFHRAAMPEMAVLQPAKRALVEGRELLHLLMLADGRSEVLTPYAATGSAGPLILGIGIAVSSIMLVRRAVGMVLLKRLIARCSRPGPETAHLYDVVWRLAGQANLQRAPEILILPPGVSGAFVVGARNPRILFSTDLAASLDGEELEAILAHEIAHISSRDVPVLVAAGVLRDMVAWNPVAHIALRRLCSDREHEADRRAASMTANPLAVASGLLKMYELMKGCRTASGRAALAFLRPGGRIARRVRDLIDVADGRVALDRPGALPYVAAAMIVATLGLQAGAQLVARDQGALAIVWGDTGSGDLWDQRRFQPTPQRNGDRGPNSQAEQLAKGKVIPQPLRLNELTRVKSQDVEAWVDRMTMWVNRQEARGISPMTLRWEARRDWTAFPLECTMAICIYRMERENF